MDGWPDGRMDGQRDGGREGRRQGSQTHLSVLSPGSPVSWRTCALEQQAQEP